MSQLTPPPNDKRALPYGAAFAIQDPETLAVLNTPLDLACLHSTTVVPEFCAQYHDWIQSTQNNRITALGDFPYRSFSQGTTEAFDKFYMRNSQRRFRCFRGEYLYHKLAWRSSYRWCYLEDDALDANDAVVISLPFSDLGNAHPNMIKVLQTCDSMNIPVLIDCAFFGICSDIDFDFSWPCITDIVFSLSKAFPVAHARIGMRYSREDHDDALLVYAKLDYVNRMSAALGSRFLDQFGPDFIPNKYRDQQQALCQNLGVEPSRTVLFGLGGREWQDYNRGLETNRLSFHKAFLNHLTTTAQ